MAEKEYIEREAACYQLEKQETIDGQPRAIRRARRIVEDFPAADVRPVVRGKWVDEPIKGIRYHCSVCQGRFDYTWHFCPNCGADMRAKPPKEET